MNIFIESMDKGKISNEHELKVMFWTLAKKLHPDITATTSGEKAFIQLKKDFDEAIKRIVSTKDKVVDGIYSGKPDMETCRSLFSELIAGNFPMTRKEGNKKYTSRIRELNKRIGLFGSSYKDLFINCEKELLKIRGNTVISNHTFNLIRLYFYNMSDYFVNRTYFSNLYVKNSHKLVMDCLDERDAHSTIQLVNWLLTGIR